jgi:flagellar biosynthesis protein FlhB
MLFTELLIIQNRAEGDGGVEAATYDPFDDYLEMMVTFGYVTLFAAAFPLASLISVVMIYFESRSDLFKLEKLVRRPRVKKAYSIGSWIYVLEFMAFTSIFTNIILFTYASDQLDHLLPFLSREHTGITNVRMIVGVFTIEHIMLVIVVILRVLLDKDPAWVKLFK